MKNFEKSLESDSGLKIHGEILKMSKPWFFQNFLSRFSTNTVNI